MDESGCFVRYINRMSNPRAHSWYRDEAHRLRTRAAAVQKDEPLRDSYLTLAREYERLAHVLEGRSPIVDEGASR